MFKRSALGALIVCAAAAQAALPEPVATLLAAANIPDDAVGVLVMRGNSVLLAHGAERRMHPGSTMKLVTTLVGLEQLGPVFRGRTELRSAAPLAKNGVLDGDLILRGGADVDFNGDALLHMLQTLRNQGIETIKGKLVYDRQLFQPARPDIGVAPFDATPEFRYNVIPDALLLNTNLLDIQMSATGNKITLLMQPPMDGVRVVSELRLVEGDCAKWEDGWKVPTTVRDKAGKLTVVLHGSFPKNCTAATSVNVLDRQDYVDRLLRTTWKNLGGKVRGASVEAATPPGTRVLAEHLARPLPEVLRDTNKWSNNTLARTLFLSLGSLEADPDAGSRVLPPSPGDSTAALAELTVRRWMKAHNIDSEGLVLENGAGLSRVERITAAEMAGVLQAGLRSNWAPEFQSSLPIAAIDGTMRRRLKDSPAATHARLKTGTLDNVLAVAGYVPDANGVACVVVAMINQDKVQAKGGRAALDALVDWVARSGG